MKYLDVISNSNLEASLKKFMEDSYMDEMDEISDQFTVELSPEDISELTIKSL